MAIVRSAFLRSLTLGSAVAVAGVLAVSGCSNTGSASAPAPTTASATTAAAPGSASAGPGPGVAATDPPGSKTAPSPVEPQPTRAPAPATSLAPDTKAYPPPDVPRSAATDAKDMAYLQSLQKGGLPISAAGTIELGIGRSVCAGLAGGKTDAEMKPLLTSAGSLGGTLSGSTLTGDQIADLYLTSAKANLC